MVIFLPDTLEFSIYVSSLIPLLLENILCMIFILLSPLRIALHSRIWSVLSVATTKSVDSAVVGWSGLYTLQLVYVCGVDIPQLL